MNSAQAQRKDDTNAPTGVSEAPAPLHPPGTTPVMAQFLDMKAAHPDCLLFFRMGDFYEMFFDDAVAAAEALGIALTKRGKTAGEDIPMCGVPIHNAERYFHDLIRKGFRVAVAEQMEDPAEAKKRGYKAVVRREVVRVVTPGTITEDGLLDRSRHNYLAAFAERREGAEMSGALAWTDMSTGDFHVATCGRQDLPAQLARLRPSEVILRGPLNVEAARLVEEAGAAATETAAASFDPKRAEARVAGVFGAASLDAFGAFTLAERAAMAALVDYLELTQKGRLPLLKPPVQERAESAMRIDAATRRNLELSVGAGGGRDGSLLTTIDRTLTNAGARLLEARMASPLAAPAAIAARLEEVALFVDAPRLREAVREALRRAPDLERALSRLGLGRGGPRDLASVRDGLLAAAAVADVLRGAASDLDLPTLLSARIDALLGHDALIDALRKGVAEDPPMRLSDGGAIADGYDPDLDKARDLSERSRQFALDMQARYQEDSGVAALKIKHNNVLGYFVETPATHQKKMMSSPLDALFVHRQTTANAVRFTTVELSELENNIARAGDQAAALEKAAFEALSKATLDAAQVIRDTAQAIAAVDVAAALAEQAEIGRWTRPKIRDDRAFRIVEGRHPVVEAALSKAGDAIGFVPNDCDLSAGPPEGEDRAKNPDDARPVWLLTGPNMAGKSTFLRQNALIAILAQMGSFVPAASAEIGVVDQLFSRVGASDDLARGRSTFMVEMVETAAILNQAGSRALVILDEIGRGTATYDGLSIAWATLEHLHEINGCRTLFATHYHELTALGAALPGLKNATMAVREWKGDVVFLRQVVAGAADRSYGVQVARLAGMPKAVVARSKELLDMLETGAESAAARAQRLVDDLPLFAATLDATEADAPSELEAALEKIDPDALSPREALDALYALKGLLRDNAA